MILLTFNIVNSSSGCENSEGFNFDDQSRITAENTFAILRILEIYDVRATFFIEINLAEKSQEFLKKIISKGHEISLYNHNSSIEDLDKTKRFLEGLNGKLIRGIREKENIHRESELKKLEFSYVSNIENADILFPFKRLVRDTTINEVNGISIVPESISPYSQLPYNDFTFQVIPMKYYQNMVYETLKNEDFVLIYLNSWQFTDLNKYPFKVPFYRKFNSGKKMEDKLEAFLKFINENSLATSRMKDYIF